MNPVFRLQESSAGAEMVRLNCITFMESAPLLYMSGEEVHAGDRVQYRAKYATVVFVSDGENEEYATGYDDYGGADRGLIVCDDDGELTTLGEPDEQLVYIGRG